MARAGGYLTRSQFGSSTPNVLLFSPPHPQPYALRAGNCTCSDLPPSGWRRALATAPGAAGRGAQEPYPG